MNPGLDWAAIVSVIGSIAAIGVSWGYSRGKAEETARRIQSLETDVWREITKLQDWRLRHDMESADYRIALERKFSEVAVKLADTNGKFQAIIERLDDFKETFIQVLDRISRLEERKRHGEN